ncbi:MAG: DUF86 domain-containing protein [Candidatus Brennerbacteria bacterium]|nr:DUF86 domain-containing protein [Candidatus Brennerbacteria bacterium]
MSSKIVIENKISDTRKYLKILERYKKYSKEEILNDIDIKGALERYLYLTTQSVIDLAEAIIAYKKLRKPTTLSDTFYILNENNIIPLELKEKMIKMTGFRNIIAHDYDKLNYDIIYNALHDNLQDIQDFLKIAEDI